MIMPPMELPSFDKLVEQFVGLECWSAWIFNVEPQIAFMLRIGKQYPAENSQESTEHLTVIPENAGHYRSEFSLFILTCSWRIENNNQIVVSSKSDKSLIIDSVTRFVIGQKIDNVRLVNSYNDLKIQFADSTILQLFVDTIANSSNYFISIYSPDFPFRIPSYNVTTSGVSISIPIADA